MGTLLRIGMLLTAAGTWPCLAQWEIGGAGGYGIYRNATIFAPPGKATTGVKDRFTVSGFIAENRYEWLSGEFRYTYHDGDPFIEAGGVRANIQGQSHAFHYDGLFHFRPRRAVVRPYVSVGVGAKQYVVTGPENPSQPLGVIGKLTSVNEWKPLLAAGGGMKVRVSDHVALRLDFRDYVTPFPKKVITPVPFATARGLLQQFTPMVGISYGL